MEYKVLIQTEFFISHVYRETRKVVSGAILSMYSDSLFPEITFLTRVLIILFRIFNLQFISTRLGVVEGVQGNVEAIFHQSAFDFTCEEDTPLANRRKIFIYGLKPYNVVRTCSVVTLPFVRPSAGE